MKKIVVAIGLLAVAATGIAGGGFDKAAAPTTFGGAIDINKTVAVGRDGKVIRKGHEPRSVTRTCPGHLPCGETKGLPSPGPDWQSAKHP